MFCDTHTHLYLPEFDADRQAIMERAISAGITRFYLPNIDLSSIEPMLGLVNEYPGFCFPMMGLHPCSIHEMNWRAELSKAGELLFSGNFCAVGEVGIDLYWNQKTLDIQREALKIQCQWALEISRPVSIHSRNATRECIEIIRPYAERGLRGVFHCFSGSKDEADEIINFGFYLGIGGVLTFKNSGLKDLLPDISPESLLLETDAPYLAPSPHRGKRNESAFIPIIAASLASLYNTDIKQIEEITTRNALNLFGNE